MTMWTVAYNKVSYKPFLYKLTTMGARESKIALIFIFAPTLCVYYVHKLIITFNFKWTLRFKFY